MIAVAVLGIFLAVFLAGCALVYVFGDPPEARKRHRRPGRRGRARAWALSWLVWLRLTDRALGRRFPLPLPRRRARLAPDDLLTVELFGVMLAEDTGGFTAVGHHEWRPRPHLLTLPARLAIQLAVMTALARAAEAQVTRPWDDPTGTFSRGALHAMLGGDR